MADRKLLNCSSSSSPPPNCAICLGSCSNKCFSDTCMHQFCFNCLLEWSKIKAECPLCKQPFKSIIHNVKSNEEYEEHIVEEPPPIHIIDNEQYLYLPQTPPNPLRQHRFHFRTTFTVNTHGENAIQQMLLSHSLTNGISISNYMPGSWPQHSRRTRRDISTTTSFRRSIYNNNLWASAPADVSGRYREVTPEYFQANPASRTRLAPWLNRELNALLHENTQDLMQLVDTIMDYLLRYHICSRSFRNLLHTYLGERTDHFVHEFYNFMRSPFDMIGYDRHLVYLPRPTSPTPYIDISEDSSDVMIIEENPVVIEVSSSGSDDDVIMTSSTGTIPKPQMLPACRRSRKRSRHIQLSSRSSSSSSSASNWDPEERSKRRKKRKLSTNEKRKKNKALKIADFVMDESSSSELDDIPLAKYLRIKASIGKRILKKSSHLSKLVKSRHHKKNHSEKSKSKKESKFIDLVSPSSPRAHCSKNIPRRRISSSSSSASSCTPQLTNPIVRVKHSTTCSSATISPDNTPPLLSLLERNKRICSEQSSTGRSVDFNYNDDSRVSNITRSEDIPKRARYSYDFNGGRSQSSPWCDRPSTSTFRPRPRANSPIDYDPSRSRSNFRQDMNLEQPLELTNHCRSMSPIPEVSSQDQAISMFTNARDPIQNFYNSPQSPDLIDLSIARLKRELDIPEYYPCSSNVPLGNDSKRCDSGQNFDFSNQSACASTSHQSKSSSSSVFQPKKEPKIELFLPDYSTENSNRYWTDFAPQSSGLASSSQSPQYEYFNNQSRKSVIQSFNNRDYYGPYCNNSNELSPVPTPQVWSDSSD